jgi:hypothetical protein
MDDKGAVLTTWLPSQCNSNGGAGHFSIALNANMGIRIEVRDIRAHSAEAGQCCVAAARFSSVQLTVGEQFPGDAARVYFVCDGVQHMFVQVCDV